MNIANSQIVELSKAKIRASVFEFEKYFQSLFDGNILVYDSPLPFREYLKSKIEEAFNLHIFNEQGIVKFAFLFLLFDDTFEQSIQSRELKTSIMKIYDQQSKNEVIDNFFYDHTEFANYWKS